MIRLETERLLLRRPVLGDLDGFAAMLGDPAVMRWLALDGRPASRHGAFQALSANIGHWELRGYGMFSVIERQSGRFVGRIGPLFPEGWPGFEIGWTLCSPYWGRGFATEAARRCLAHAFEDLDQAHVVSLILPDNQASIRVAERIGEMLEGVVTLPHLPADTSVLQYGIDRDAWRHREPQRRQTQRSRRSEPHRDARDGGTA
ncbi:MAG: GNAT family N-acetyltransferase [Vicinamibacterales bacterium]